MNEREQELGFFCSLQEILKSFIGTSGVDKERLKEAICKSYGLFKEESVVSVVDDVLWETHRDSWIREDLGDGYYSFKKDAPPLSPEDKERLEKINQRKERNEYYSRLSDIILLSKQKGISCDAWLRAADDCFTDG